MSVVDTSNPSFVLNVNKVVPPTSVSISLATSQITPQSDSEAASLSDAAASMGDIDNTSRFDVLLQKGLNPLRSYLIASTEFLPISLGTDAANESTINITLGDDSTITATNAARLIELHRQIRKYIIEVSQSLLNRRLEVDINSIKNHIVNTVRSNRYRIYKETIEETVENLINILTGSSVGYVQQSSDTSTDTSNGTSTGDDLEAGKKSVNSIDYGEVEAVKEIILSNEGNLGNSGTAQPSQIINVFEIQKIKSNTYFISLVEYILYDILIEDVINYLSGILKLKDKLDESYGIDAINFNQSNLSTLSLKNQIVDSFININFGSGYTNKKGNLSDYSQASGRLYSSPLFQNELRVGDEVGSYEGNQHVSISQAKDGKYITTIDSDTIAGSELLSDLVGFKRTEGNSDVDLLMNCMANICSLTLLKDSVQTYYNNESVKYRDEENTITPGHIRNYIKGDLQDTMKYLSKFTLQGMLVSEEQGPDAIMVNGIDYENSSGVDENRYPRVLNTVNLENLVTGRFFDENNNQLSIEEHLEEMATAIAFDEFYAVTSENISSIESSLQYPSLMSQDPVDFVSPRVLTNRGRPDDTATAPIFTYLTKVFGSSFTRHGTNKVTNYTNSVSTNPPPEFGDFAKLFLKIRDIDNTKVAPFESTIKLQSSDSYMTGPEHYISRNILRGDLDFNEIEDLLDEYEKKASAVLQDVIVLCGLNSGPNAKDTPTLSPIGYGSPVRYIDTVINMFKETLNQGNLLATTAMHYFMYTKHAGNKTDFIKCFKSTFSSVLLDLCHEDIEDSPIEHWFDVQRAATGMDGSGPLNRMKDSLGASLQAPLENVIQKFLKSDLGMKNLNTDTEGHQMLETGATYERIAHEGGYQANIAGKDDFHTQNSWKVINEGVLDQISSTEGTDKVEYFCPRSGDDLLARDFGIWREQVNQHKIYHGGLRLSQFGSSNEKDHGTELFDNDDKTAAGPAYNIGGDTRELLEGMFTHQYAGFTNSAKNAIDNFKNNKPVYNNIFVSLDEKSDDNQLLNDQWKWWKWKKHMWQTRFKSIHRIGGHQRMLVFQYWYAKLLQKVLIYRARTKKIDGTRHFIVKTYRECFEAMNQALHDHTNDRTKNAFIDYPDKNTLWKLSYTETYKYVSSLRNRVIRRQESIIANCLMFVLHAAELKKRVVNLKNYVNGVGQQSYAKQAITFARNEGILEESLLTLSKESINQMYANWLRTYKISKNNIFTNEDNHNIKCLKMMYKILSKKGFGFNLDEKRGNKMVFHVGITNSLMSTLRQQAYEKTKNRKFLYSNLVSVNVFKRNQFNSAEAIYPKTFIFDVSAYILDHNKENEYLPHILNYKDSWTFEDILNNINITRYTDLSNPASSNSLENDKFAPSIIQGASSVAHKDILKNHLFDYALKKYYELLLGLDVKDANYILSKSVLNYDEVAASGLTSQQDLKDFFTDLDNFIIQLYPASNVDPKLAAETFRVLNLTRQAPGLSNKNKLKRALYPKMFDRIFSVFVNEKDFVLHTSTIDKNFSDIYPNSSQLPIDFNVTPEISRPDDVRNIGARDGNIPQHWIPINDDSTAISTLRTYANSTKEGFPTVESYYVSVTLLPSDACDDL